MSSFMTEYLEGKIDFRGQKSTDDIARMVLMGSTAVSFVAGFALQSLTVTFGIFGAATAVLALVVVPPWPAYNKHPVQWLPAKTASAGKT